MRAHTAAEDSVLDPAMGRFYGGEFPVIQARLRLFTDKIASVMVTIASFSCVAPTLHTFAQELLDHNTYETSTLLPPMDNALPAPERSALLIALNERTSSSTAGPAATSATTTARTVKADCTGLPANAGSAVPFSGPTYPYAK